MTEKRFAGEFDNQYSGVYDDGEQLSNFEVVKLLNELAEENKGFKIDGEFKNKAYSKLLDSFMELKKKYQGIKKENKELKGKLEVYRELYPSGKWICDLNSDELKKELEE